VITSDFSAYAVKIDVHLHESVPAGTLQSCIESLLSTIAKECMAAGATLIGHIKCLANTADHGFLAVSVVDERAEPRSRGGLDDGIEEIEIVLNVLLYGLSRDKVEDIVERTSQVGLAIPGAHIHLKELDEDHHEGGQDHEHHDHEH
jgi:hypothetical protein